MKVILYNQDGDTIAELDCNDLVITTADKDFHVSEPDECAITICGGDLMIAEFGDNEITLQQR